MRGAGDAVPKAARGAPVPTVGMAKGGGGKAKAKAKPKPKK